MVNSIQLLM